AMPHALAAGNSQHISLLWSLPFAVLLICTALFPLLQKHWWEKHYAKVAFALAVIPAGYYFLAARDPVTWLHAMQEYISFIVLLASLYVVSGGIYISIKRKATPAAHAALLLIGAVLANIRGTTGAAMLLIRPYLRINAGHSKPCDVISFIF